MSTKSTILNLPCCHIYYNCIGSNGGDTLVISVDYGNTPEGGDDNNRIEVEADSEFAKLIIHLLNKKNQNKLRKITKGEAND